MADPTALAADLHLQWQDHFHVRDQTWRTLWAATPALAVVLALALGGAGTAACWSAWAGLALLCAAGILTAIHHRRCQREKFAFIARYEELLGLVGPAIKGALLARHRERRSPIPGLHTQSFVAIAHVVYALLGLVALLAR
ncbi:MAG: hypothetical protein ACOCYP_08640 [Planctomycetota bacterium]